MIKEKCLILGSESVDSNSINRCLHNLYKYTLERTSLSLNATSENYPSSPFFSGGIENSLTDTSSPIKSLGLTEATSAAAGVIRRLYGGSLTTDVGEKECFYTNSATGAYYYNGEDIDRFAPSVKTLFSEDAPFVFSSLIGDETTTLTSGVSSLGTATAPTIKFNSYMLCGYTGVAYGTITFKRENGDVQNNVLSLNIRRDLIGKDHVDTIKFFTIGNGYGSGVKTISENNEMVSDITACNVTFVSEDDVVITNISKNDNSETIRIDRDTGRILDEDEVRSYGEYTEIPNDNLVLSYYVVFDLRKDSIDFDESTWCFYITKDASYAKTRLYNADSYARGNIRCEFLGFEAADDGYVDDVDDSHTFTQDGSHVCHNASITAKDAFNGCFNAKFPKLCYFSNRLRNTDRMFKDCHSATFDALPATFELTSLRTATSMFEKCAAATFGTLNTLNFSNATNLRRMFARCNNAEFSDLTKVTIAGNCKEFFYGDYTAEFENLDVINGSAYNLESFFKECDNARLPELTQIISTSTALVYASEMCYDLDGCKFDKLAKINLSTGSGYVGDSMFYHCSNATFDVLSDIGNPYTSISMFKSCSAATFGNLHSLGTKLIDGRKMFQDCWHLNTDITESTDSLVNGSYMFDTVSASDSKIVISGNMNGLTTSEMMFGNCNLAIVNGNMNGLQDAQNMFTYSTSGLVYGGMPNLVIAQNMFSSCDYALLSYVGTKLYNMINTFSNTQSTCVLGWNGLLTSSNFPRICEGTFIGSKSVAITGDILSGYLESTSRMFEDAGNISIRNMNMSSVTDVANRWYQNSGTSPYTVYQKMLEKQHTIIYGQSDIETTLAEYGDDSVGLELRLSENGPTYKLCMITNGHAIVEEIEESEAKADFNGYSVSAPDGNNYFLSKILNEAEKNETWFFYSSDDSLEVKEKLDYFINMSWAKSTESNEFNIENRQTTTSTVRTSVNVRTEFYDTTYKLVIKPGITGQSEIIIDNLASAETSISLNYVMDDGKINPVMIITTNGSITGKNINRYKFDETGYVTEFYEFEEEDFLIKPSTSYSTVKVFQLTDTYRESSKFAYLLKIDAQDTKNLKYMLYKGEFSGELPDFETVQGDLYSIEAIFDNTATTLDNPSPIVEIDVSQENLIPIYWTDASRMFYNATGSSVLSGYDSFIGPYLKNVESMFAMPDGEQNTEDAFFDNCGHLFKLMDSCTVSVANDMFRNRYISTLYPFFDYSNNYSFHIPTQTQTMTGMFNNTTMHDPTGTITEIGLNIPTTVNLAIRAFKGFDGPDIRFGYASDGAVVFNDRLWDKIVTPEFGTVLRSYEMFGSWSDDGDVTQFANDVTANYYTISIKNMHNPIFRGSDFEYNDVSHLIDRSGLYFIKNDDEQGSSTQFTIADKFIENGAQFKNLADDITTWFDEGVYLASVLGPSDDNYRFETAPYTMAKVSQKEYLEELVSGGYTDSVRFGEAKIFSGDRCTAMFNPMLVIAASNNTQSDQIGNTIKSMFNLEHYESNYSNLKDKLSVSRQSTYNSLVLEKLRTITCYDMPFMFSGLKNTTLESVSYIGGSGINASGAFADMNSATFNSLATVEEKFGDSAETFKNAFLSSSETTGYISNYTNMFADDGAASMKNLETVALKSQYYTMYPSDTSNSLNVWREEVDGKTVIAFSLYNETLSDERDYSRTYKLKLCKTDVTSGETTNSFWGINITGESYYNERSFTEQFDETVNTNIEYLITEEAEPPKILFEFGEISKSTVEAESNYKFILIFTVTNSENENTYFSIKFDSNGYPIISEHSVHPAEEEGYGDTHTVYKFTDVDESSVYTYNAHDKTYKIQLIKDEPSDTYHFRVDDYNEFSLISMSTRIPLAERMDLDLYEDSNDDGKFLAVKFGNDTVSDFYYIYDIDEAANNGIIREVSMSEYTPSSTAKHNHYTLKYNTPEEIIYFGDNQYKIEFVNDASKDTFCFNIIQRSMKEIAEFISDISTSRKLKSVDIDEEYMTADETGFSEDGYVLIVNFSNTDMFYYISSKGEIMEHIAPAVITRYRERMDFYYESFTKLNTRVHCDGMFRGCVAALFVKLSYVTTARVGSCSYMFKDCKNGEFSKLRTLYLPTAYREDGETECYKNVFEGCFTSKLNMSALTKNSTNIYALGYGSSKTKGKYFFSGVHDNEHPTESVILTKEDAINKLKMKEEIAELFDWN